MTTSGVTILALATALMAGPDPALTQASCSAAAVVFAPGVVSVPNSHDDYLALSPDGTRAVFTRLAADYSGGTLYESRRSGSGWSQPVQLPFSGQHADSRPAFAPDGRSLVFASNRPHAGATAARSDLDLWTAPLDNDRWGVAAPLPGSVNTASSETHPSMAADGTLYFVRWADNRPSRNDIFSAELRDGSWTDVAPVEAVNSMLADSHVSVDPNERVMFFARLQPETGDDVFWSRRTSTGWSAPEALSAVVNTVHYEYSAKVSPDQSRIFFSRNGHWSKGEPADILSVPVCAIPAIAAALGSAPQ